MGNLLGVSESPPKKKYRRGRGPLVDPEALKARRRPSYEFGRIDFRLVTRHNWAQLCNMRARCIHTQLAILHRAMEVDPHNPLIYAFLCHLLVRCSCSLEVTTRAFYRVLDLANRNCPEHEQLFLTLLHVQKAHFGVALQHIRTETHLFPDFAYSWYMVSRVASTLGLFLPEDHPRHPVLAESVATNLACCVTLPGHRDFVGSSIFVSMAMRAATGERYERAERYIRKETKYCCEEETVALVQILAAKKDMAGVAELLDRRLRKCHYSDIPKLLRTKLTLFMDDKKLSKDVKIDAMEAILQHSPRQPAIWRAYCRMLLSVERFNDALVASNKYTAWCMDDVVAYDFFLKGGIHHNLLNFKGAELNFRIAVLLAGGDELGVLFSRVLDEVMHDPRYPPKDRLSGDWKNVFRERQAVRLALLQKTLQEGTVAPEELDDLHFLIFIELIRFKPTKVDYYVDMAAERCSNKVFWKQLCYGDSMTESPQRKEERLQEQKMNEPDFDPLGMISQEPKSDELTRRLRSEKLTLMHECIDLYEDWIPPILIELLCLKRHRRPSAKNRGRSVFEVVHEDDGDDDEGLDDIPRRPARPSMEDLMTRCRELVRKNPMYNHFFYYLLSGFMMQEKRYEEALQYLTEYEESCGDRGFSLGILLSRGDVLKKMKKNAVAREAYLDGIDRLEEVCSRDTDLGWADMGLLYSELSEVAETPEDALRWSRQATKYNPLLLKPYRRRLDVLKSTSPREAAEEICCAVELRGEPRDFVGRASARLRMHDPFGAEEDLRMYYLLQDPGDLEGEGEFEDMANRLFATVTRCAMTGLKKNASNTFVDVEFVYEGDRDRDEDQGETETVVVDACVGVGVGSDGEAEGEGEVVERRALSSRVLPPTELNLDGGGLGSVDPATISPRKLLPFGLGEDEDVPSSTPLSSRPARPPPAAAAAAAVSMSDVEKQAFSLLTRNRDSVAATPHGRSEQLPEVSRPRKPRPSSLGVVTRGVQTEDSALPPPPAAEPVVESEPQPALSSRMLPFSDLDHGVSAPKSKEEGKPE